MKIVGAWVAHLVSYPVSLVVIARWMPVVRERRWRWFVAHQAAMVGIVTGWLLRGSRGAVTVNGTWLVVSTAWYALGRGTAARGGANE